MGHLNQHPLSHEEPLVLLSVRAAATSGQGAGTSLLVSASRSSGVTNLQCDCSHIQHGSARHGSALCENGHHSYQTELALSEQFVSCKNLTQCHTSGKKTRMNNLDFHVQFCEHVESWRKLLCSAKGV